MHTRTHAHIPARLHPWRCGTHDTLASTTGAAVVLARCSEEIKTKKTVWRLMGNIHCDYCIFNIIDSLRFEDNNRNTPPVPSNQLWHNETRTGGPFRWFVSRFPRNVSAMFFFSVSLCGTQAWRGNGLVLQKWYLTVGVQSDVKN